MKNRSQKSQKRRILTVALLFLLLVYTISFIYYISKVQPIESREDLDSKQLIDQIEDRNKKLQEEIKALEVSRNALKDQYEEIKLMNLSLQQKIKQREAAYRVEVENNLVDILTMDPGVIVDLRYATEDNFMKYQAYPDNSRALLRRETAIKLIRASEIFKEDGYTLKIWDAYRPLSVQQIMWDHSPIPGYVADPSRGSNHNRGAAVDITLVDGEGNELEMPTGFDDFTEKAARDYDHHTAEAKKNMDYMTQVMVNCGFKGIRTEWWHFKDVDSINYPLLDVGLDSFY
ncbi:MAG TPA: hypothetical protein DIW17_03335 [Clostridiales bacterium]|nr:M15 family metallopeptidase [Clostridia bacterium]HCS72890.1 hypothetical protein [Clostridiales bacterium]